METGFYHRNPPKYDISQFSDQTAQPCRASSLQSSFSSIPEGISTGDLDGQDRALELEWSQPPCPPRSNEIEIDQRQQRDQSSSEPSRGSLKCHSKRGILSGFRFLSSLFCFAAGRFVVSKREGFAGIVAPIDLYSLATK